MRVLIQISLFAGLTMICGLIRIPFFPVPITMQTLAVLLSGCLLGAKYGAMSQMLFLVLGLTGLPVFSQGGGLGYVMQPGFGYLLAFPIAAYWIGLIVPLNETMTIRSLGLAFMTGSLIILVLGSLYLFGLMNWILHKSLSIWKVILSGIFIFIPGEVIKGLLAAVIVKRTYRTLKPFLPVAVLLLGLMFYSSESYAQNQDLNQIRREIEQLENDIKAKAFKERSLLDQLEDIDREIGLRSKLLKELEVQSNQKERDIRSTKRELEETTDEFNRLQEIIKNRLVAMYKRGNVSNLEILLTSGSFNRMLIWMKYQQRIVENDRRNLKLFKEKRDQIIRQQSKLERELGEKRALITEKKKEVETSNQQKQERSQLLATVQKDKKLLSQRLERKRRAYAQIAQQIKEEEKKRQAAPRTEIVTNFASLKGRLDWPVSGTVVAKYGRYKDKDLNIFSENQGIDIKARAFENVHAVCKGVVSMKTWLPVFGNTIILDHGEGYYTVYSRLQNVFVNTGDVVENGMLVGEVGDQQSMNKTLLQFQVWKGQNHINPLTWLKKG